MNRVWIAQSTSWARRRACSARGQANPLNPIVPTLRPSPEQGLDRAEHILGLAASVFRVDSVIVWLAEGDRVFVRAGCKAFPPGSRSACCHLLVPDKQVLVVADTDAEPRWDPCWG